MKVFVKLHELHEDYMNIFMNEMNISEYLVNILTNKQPQEDLTHISNIYYRFYG